MRKKYGNWTVIGTPKKNSKGKLNIIKFCAAAYAGRKEWWILTI